MFKAITAYSRSRSTQDIENDLLVQAYSKLGCYRPSTGILFASCPHNQDKFTKILKRISRAFPQIKLIGSTVVGGFTEESGYTKDGFLLCLIISDTVEMTAGCLRNLSQFMQHNELAQAFNNSIQRDSSSLDATACLLYSAYNGINHEALIQDVQELLPEGCIVIGGLASDYWSERDIAEFSQKTPPAENTLLFFADNGDVYVGDDAVVFLLFHGNVSASYGFSYGWSDVGMLYPAKAEGSFITELDGKEPQMFLQQLSHPFAADSHDNMEYPFWIHVPGQDPYLRDIFFDKKSGRYYAQGTAFPRRFQISFSFPSKEKVLDEYRNCFHRFKNRYDFIIVNTCCTHQVVLGNDIEKEYSSLMATVRDTPVIGGYVFGEFGPSPTARQSVLHSCSSITLCLEEIRDNCQPIDHPMQFYHQIIKEQKQEIRSLQRQLRFFEASKDRKGKRMTEDCLGLLLCRSSKSLSNHAEQMSNLLKTYYAREGITAPYAVSRNRLIEHLMTLKQQAEKIVK